jgi:hypothetical protein
VIFIQNIPTPSYYGISTVDDNSFSFLSTDSSGNLQFSILMQTGCVGDYCQMDGAYFSIPSTAILLTNKTQQRTGPFNSIDAFNNTFLHFSSSILVKYDNNFDISVTIFDVSLYSYFKIVDTFY